MLMIRFKLLAAGVMVATGLGLSVGGGWSGEATAQPGSLKPLAQVDPNIAKLKAELEKAKAELAKAEAEARDRDRTMQLRLSRDLTPKYEYEPLLGKGLTTRAFEQKLAEREKAGWEFLGQVPFDTSLEFGAIGAGKDGTTPCLVFRKKEMDFVLGRFLVLGPQDYGNWDPKDLVDVLKKVMADDVKAKKYAGTIEFVSEKDHFKVTGSPEALAAVAEWVKKLKK